MSVTAAKGFKAFGLHAGIKADGVLDTSVIVADEACAAAAVFTSSFTAAPVIELARRHMVEPSIRTIVVNSGCANAGTGAAGMQVAEEVAAAAASHAGCAIEEVIVASTGPIGSLLPVDKVLAALEEAYASATSDEDAGTKAAAGIMTTDSVTKEAVAEGNGYLVGGMSKGAGMVRPDMATMLAYLTTDAVVSPDRLYSALKEAVDLTFNSLNIDGCQSTNDMVVLMASGASGVEPDPEEFAMAVTGVCRDLAWQMAQDAEGASRVVTMHISGAVDDDAARDIGKVVADSALVRSSFYGADPNWGRVLGALGVTGWEVDPDDIEIAYAGVVVARSGVAVPFDEPAVIAELEKGDFELDIVVGSGPGAATIVTTDLTPDYVVFNGERS